MAPNFTTRSSVAVDVEMMRHHLGATDLGAELGAVNLAANPVLKKNWLTK